MSIGGDQTAVPALAGNLHGLILSNIRSISSENRRINSKGLAEKNSRGVREKSEGTPQRSRSVASALDSSGFFSCDFFTLTSAIASSFRFVREPPPRGLSRAVLEAGFVGLPFILFVLLFL